MSMYDKQKPGRKPAPALRAEEADGGEPFEEKNEIKINDRPFDGEL